MKSTKLIIILILMSFLTKAQPVDKLLHVSAGYGIASVTSAVSYNLKVNEYLVIGIGAGTIAGIGKEVRDQYVYKGWDNKDLLATALGSIAGSLVIKYAVSGVKDKEKHELVQFKKTIKT